MNKQQVSNQSRKNPFIVNQFCQNTGFQRGGRSISPNIISTSNNNNSQNCYTPRYLTPQQQPTAIYKNNTQNKKNDRGVMNNQQNMLKGQNGGINQLMNTPIQKTQSNPYLYQNAQNPQYQQQNQQNQIQRTSQQNYYMNIQQKQQQYQNQQYQQNQDPARMSRDSNLNQKITPFFQTPVDTRYQNQNVSNQKLSQNPIQKNNKQPLQNIENMQVNSQKQIQVQQQQQYSQSHRNAQQRKIENNNNNNQFIKNMDTVQQINYQKVTPIKTEESEHDVNNFLKIYPQTSKSAHPEQINFSPIKKIENPPLNNYSQDKSTYATNQLSIQANQRDIITKSDDYFNKHNQKSQSHSFKNNMESFMLIKEQKKSSQLNSINLSYDEQQSKLINTIQMLESKIAVLLNEIDILQNVVKKKMEENKIWKQKFEKLGKKDSFSNLSNSHSHEQEMERLHFLLEKRNTNLEELQQQCHQSELEKQQLKKEVQKYINILNKIERENVNQTNKIQVQRLEKQIELLQKEDNQKQILMEEKNQRIHNELERVQKELNQKDLEISQWRNLRDTSLNISKLEQEQLQRKCADLEKELDQKDQLENQLQKIQEMNELQEKQIIALKTKLDFLQKNPQQTSQQSSQQASHERSQNSEYDDSKYKEEIRRLKDLLGEQVHAVLDQKLENQQLNQKKIENEGLILSNHSNYQLQEEISQWKTKCGLLEQVVQKFNYLESTLNGQEYGEDNLFSENM